MKLQRMLEILYWNTLFFVEPAKYILPKHNLKDYGIGYTAPRRTLAFRCCRCNHIYILGQATEMYGHDSGWWHECVRCALASMTYLVENPDKREVNEDD